MTVTSAPCVLFVLLLASPLAAVSVDAGTNPLGKVLDLLEDLAAKVAKEGEAEAKAYAEYVEWCDDASKNAKFAIETASSDKEKLEAKIGELTGNIAAGEAKISELAGATAKADADLKDATLIRDKEAGDFAASEKELMAAIDTLDRAVGILEKEMSKNPASLAQVDTTSVAATMRALSAILNAAAFPGTDKSRLQALLQSQQEGTEGMDAEEAALGAPAAATYKTQSGGIFDVLEDLKEKAEGQLSDLRKAEVNTKHNFDMLKQSLEDQSAADKKDMEEEKTGKAANEEGKATAEGDLELTSKQLADSSTELETTHASCLTVAADHEATAAGRTEELRVLAEAKQILVESSSGAVSQSYSLLQLGAGLRMQTRADLARSEAIVLVKNLARQYHSEALAQLASRLSAVAKLGAAGGEDPFAKIKGLIQDMIAKLEREAGAEATEKAYCDEELAKTEAKRDELDEDIAKMTARIDQAAAKSAELKEQIKVLEEELAALTREQAEMDKIRQETHEDYAVAKSDLELGLGGVRKALRVLRDYYASAPASMLQDDAKLGAFMQQPTPPEKHGKAGGAGSSIIGILEVVESDFATNLAKEEAQEADAQSEYEKVSQENAVAKTLKEQDVTYKTQEYTALDKTVAEYSSDRDSASAERSAVLEYYNKLRERCIAKPETYEARKARREAEIAGLKAALATLEEETALVQRKQRGRRMRGALLAR